MWKSIDDLIHALGLSVSPGDLEGVEKALKQQLLKVHPDTTNGEFASNTQKERFHRVSEALELVQRQKSGIPALAAADIPAVVEATLLALRQASPQPTQSRPAVMENVRRELRHSNRLPKITSAMLFTVCASVFTFIGSFSEHPLLKGLVTHPEFLWLIGTVCVISGVSLIRVWLREQSTEREFQDRLSEQAIQEAFQTVCLHADQSPMRRFSRSDVVESQLESRSISPFVLRRHGHKVPFYMWRIWLRELLMPPAKIGQHAAEEIATFYLNRWSERGAIKRSTYADSAEWFEVEASVLERHR